MPVEKKARNEDIREAYRRGLSAPKIAVLYDMSVSNVYRILDPDKARKQAMEKFLRRYGVDKQYTEKVRSRGRLKRNKRKSDE